MMGRGGRHTRPQGKELREVTVNSRPVADCTQDLGPLRCRPSEPSKWTLHTCGSSCHPAWTSVS